MLSLLGGSQLGRGFGGRLAINFALVPFLQQF
jgi:hypothetical protein